MRWNSFKTRPANGRALYSVRMDGTHNRRLTPWKLGAGDHPAFSPNGRDVFFHSFAEEDEQAGRTTTPWTSRPAASPG